MVLITPELARTLPAKETKNEQGQTMVHAKFFCPWGSWTWYLVNYDRDEEIAFGLVKGMEIELGDFSMAELQTVKGPMGLGIERDIHFKPMPLEEIQKIIEAGGHV